MSRSGRHSASKSPAWYLRQLSVPVVVATLLLPASSSMVKADSTVKPSPSPRSSLVEMSVSNYLNDRLHQTSASRARKVTALTKQISAVKKSMKNVRVNGNQLLTIAARYKGVPYVSGGTTPRGFDCSGYTQFVYRQLGIELPRVAQDQMKWSTRISASEARPGDLAFYLTGNYAYHAAIYAGNGMIWHSPHPGTSVTKVKIRNHKMAYGRIPTRAITPGLQAQLHALNIKLAKAAKSPTK